LPLADGATIDDDSDEDNKLAVRKIGGKETTKGDGSKFSQATAAYCRFAHDFDVDHWDLRLIR